MQWGWEDYALWIDILKRGKTLTVIPEVLVLYRTKETSMITEANKHAEELYAQMRKDHPDLPWK
jgi:hypoxanthine-guanine phosphoribosyltransferase